MKKVLVINGHPNKAAFNFGMSEAYAKGAISAGAQVQQLVVADMEFNPNLKFGYQKVTLLEQDLVDAWEKITWADHLVWVHPVWWGGLPAITKGFIDRIFLPGQAFKFKQGSSFWEKLLKGKTAHIITTLDQPGWYYWLFYGKPSVNQLKKSTLEFCGVSPVKVSYFGIIKTSTDSKRKQWISKAEALGKRLK